MTPIQALQLAQQTLLSQQATIKTQADSINTLTHDRDSAVAAAKANADDAQAARDLRDFLVANADKLGIQLPQ